MRPEILILGSGWMPAVGEALERHFVCHRLAQPAQEAPGAGAASIDAVGARVRAVFTSGTVGIDAGLAARLPRLEIVAVHYI